MKHILLIAFALLAFAGCPPVDDATDDGSDCSHCQVFCEIGQACGDSCISSGMTCTKPPGIACNVSVCPRKSSHDAGTPYIPEYSW